MSQPWSPEGQWGSAPAPAYPPVFQQPPYPPVGGPVPGRPSRAWLLGGIGGAIALALAAGAGGYVWGHAAASSAAASAASASAAASASSADGRLADAYNSCTSADTGNTLQLEDDGGTIVVDTRSKYGSAAGVACVFEHLGTPSSITAKVDSTTAMMGEQSATHDGISYSWSYHPDNGLNMVIALGG